ANTIVRTEIEARREDRKIPKDERTEGAILEWVSDAIEQGGAAHWGRPNIIDPESAKDQLQSKFVLKVVAYHLRMSMGSIWSPEDDESADPIGAIALAACAIERSFEWYSKNQLKGLPQAKFSKKLAGADMGRWRDSAVQDLIDKPHRLERMLTGAMALVSVPLRTAVPKHTVNRLYVRERSSSPPAVPYDADEE
ncbi:hypothetical protein K466DRAFT_504393, partial [Polyporus arcularius HHB13444]